MLKQLILFFGLSYALSWTIWLPLYAPTLGMSFGDPIPLQHALGAFGPFIASLFLTGLQTGTAGLKALAKRLTHPDGFIYALIALLSPFQLEAIAIAIHFVQTGNMEDLTNIGRTNEFPRLNIILFFIYNLVFFGFGEEAGWRGYALPRLQVKYNALVSSFILTLFWALWHLPLFLYRPGYITMDAAGIAGWFFSLLTGSVLLTWLFNSTRGSILVCAIFHSAVDVAFTSDYLDKNLVGLMGMLITIWGIAAIFIFKFKDLSFMKRVTNVEGR
jgi:membrane protease YdiL (CAAX protease family)